MKRRQVEGSAVLLVCAAVAGLAMWREGGLGGAARNAGTIAPSPANAARVAGEPRPPRPGLEALDRHLPFAFERNDGQVDSAVRFFTRGAGFQLYFTRDGATWALSRLPRASPLSRETIGAATASASTPAVDVLRMRLVGARGETRVTGAGEQPGKAHYFRGSNPNKWQTNVPLFARLHYSQVYSGIDLHYYSRQGQLEYDFVVAAGADPGAIGVSFEGAQHVSIDTTGDLVIATSAGRLVQRRPIAYQQQAGERRAVDCRYVFRGDHEVGFALGAYDTNEPLIIDPILVYSTFLGGSGGSYGEQAYGVAVDRDENVYVTGKTLSAVFPAASGSPANNDVFVVKMTPSGAIAYVAVINGNASDSGEGIAVDSLGQAIVTGFTDSSDFPTLNPIHLNRSSRDAFLMKLDPAGLIVYSTYVGGSSSFDYGEAVAVDADGYAYMVGATKSSDLPVLNAIQPVVKGQDAFLVKVDPDGNLFYATYLGGSGSEAAESVAVDSGGSFYVTGWTGSSNFPRVGSTAGKQAGQDVFVTKFTPDGSAFVYSRYLGGNANDRGYAVALGAAGGAFVAGLTDSTNFPAVLAFQADQPGTDAFLTGLDPDGQVVFSTYAGGNGWERLLALSAADGFLYATGQTFSTDLPTLNALQPAKAGDTTTADVFVMAIDIASSALAYSTYLGGNAIEEGRGIAALSGGNLFVAGWTESADFPTVRPLQDYKSNIGNVFISRIAPVGVDAVAPGFAEAAGGSALTIGGQGFATGAAVRFNGAAALTSFVVDGETIAATTPSLPVGPVDITVVNPDGGSGTLYGQLIVVNGTGPIADAGPDQSLEASGLSGTPVVLDGTASFDPDNEPLAFRWTDENGNIVGTTALATAVLPIGAHTITLTVSDGHSTPGVDTLSVAIVDTTPPAVMVTAPNTADKIYTGTPAIIEWTASDQGAISSFDVYSSTDGGATYGSAPICAGVSGMLRSCTWATPGPVTSGGRIRVIARDAAGNTSSDVSNSNFTIVTGTALVKVTSPNTNVNWGAGSTQQIKWNHNLGSTAFVRIEASFDGGASWSLVNAAVKNTARSSGVYNWTLPAVLSSAARVRVSWKNGPVSDQSDANFTIAAPFLSMSAPSGGANWGYGTTQRQTWATNLGPLDRVDVVLSTDGGATFPIHLANVAASTKSATFTTPTLGAATATARTRAIWINAPAGLGVQAANPANFRVEPPFVTVTFPNGGNTWAVGSKKTVTWSHNLGGLERVRLELSTDNGASYPIVMVSSTPSDGGQAVTALASWATTAGRVRITWIESAAVADESNGSFVIQ